MRSKGVLNENMEKMISKVYSIFLLMYTILFILHITFFEYHFQVLFSRSDCVIGAILALLLAARLINTDMEHRKKWFKANILVFIYFAIRTITLIKTGFDYSTIRCIFFEGVYLLALTDVMLTSSFVKKAMIPVTICVTFLINIINTYLYYYYYNVIITDDREGMIYDFIVTYSGYIKNPNYYYSLMYTNPNWFGMLTALTILLAIVLVEKKNKKLVNVFLIIYILFSLYCVWLSTCRSAIIALFVVACVYLFIKIFKRINSKSVVIVCLTGAIIVMCIVAGFIVSNDDTGMREGYTEKEHQLDQYGSRRYSIWKECYYANKDDIVLGQGSLARELSLRIEFFDDEYGDTKYVQTQLRPHNGYIGHLIITGILGLILFISIIYQRIRRSAYMTTGNWYLVIVLVFIINLFECMFTLGTNILCLYMFTILSMAEEEQDVLLEEEK